MTTRSALCLVGTLFLWLLFWSRDATAAPPVCHPDPRGAPLSLTTGQNAVTIGLPCDSDPKLKALKAGDAGLSEVSFTGGILTLNIKKVSADKTDVWNPVSGTSTVADGATEYTQTLLLAAPEWQAAIGPQLTVRFDSTTPAFCSTLTLDCGATPATIACDDWSTMQSQQQTAIAGATLYMGVDGAYVAAKADATGNFAADAVCKSKSPKVSAAFLVAGGGAGLTTTSPVTVQASTTLKGTCEVRDNFYSKRLAEEVKAAWDGGGSRPILIISYAKISKYFAAWQFDCADLGPLNEKVEDGHIDEPQICMLGDERPDKKVDPAHQYFPTGAPLLVYVIHDAQVDAQVYATQSQSLTTTQVLSSNGAIAVPVAPGSNSTPPGSTAAFTFSKKHAPSRVTPAQANDCILDRYQLAPRAPGPFTVISELVDSDGALIAGSYRTLEMLVDQKYVGALRAGVAMSFPFFGPWLVGSGLYGARTFGVHQAGNGANLIYQDAYSIGDFELTFGYTQFWKARYASALRCDFWKCGPTPVIALGVVSATPTGTFNVLTSTYAGFEFEIGSLITLQLMPLGMRRDTVLANDFNVGSPVPAGTTSAPTATQLHYAMAFSVSFDADLLRIAAVTLP